jgi:hypothetical protein
MIELRRAIALEAAFNGLLRHEIDYFGDRTFVFQHAHLRFVLIDRLLELESDDAWLEAKRLVKRPLYPPIDRNAPRGEQT